MWTEALTHRGGATNQSADSSNATSGAIDGPVHTIANPGDRSANTSGCATLPAGSTNEPAGPTNSATTSANATFGPINPIAESTATAVRHNDFVCRRGAAAAGWPAATSRPIDRPSRPTNAPRGPSNRAIGARLIAAGGDVVSCGSINGI